MKEAKKSNNPEVNKESDNKLFDGTVKVGKWGSHKLYTCLICGWNTTDVKKIEAHIKMHYEMNQSKILTDIFGNKIKY